MHFCALKTRTLFLPSTFDKNTKTKYLFLSGKTIRVWVYFEGDLWYRMLALVYFVASSKMQMYVSNTFAYSFHSTLRIDILRA
jgi:dTDP-4-dehydrorhamnose 3,5-epimerase-like enzyme